MIFLLPAIIIVSSIPIVIVVIDQVISKKVKSHSSRLKNLEALNASTSFHHVEDSFTNSKHYDNKSNFNKIQSSYIMAAHIRTCLDYFLDVTGKIKENQTTYEEYIKKTQEIKSNITAQECKELYIPLSVYQKKEQKLFNEALLTPPLDFTYTVVTTYSSPKGKVNLKKEESFDLSTIIHCIDSVSRSKLSREMYTNIALVERGNVSDSLRYDIMNRDGFKCVICGASAKEGAHLHIDHIIPIAKGGKSIPSNLRTLCERCNIGKSDKLETAPEPQPAENNSPDADNELVCPKCKGRLVVRDGTYGEFYGCSNYPKCRYTKNINR